MSDAIFLKGLALHAFHGVMQHEAKVGQTFHFDLQLALDLGSAARTDKLKDTVSYDLVIKTATEAFCGHRYQLVEARRRRGRQRCAGSLPPGPQRARHGEQAACTNRGDIQRCRRDHRTRPQPKRQLKGRPMMPYTRRQSFLLPIVPLILSSGIAQAAELNPAAVAFKLPDQIPWGPPSPAGAQNAVLVGDPAKEGLYVVMVKWPAGNHFSHPHFHPHDRFITVLKGTWWVGTGTKFDPDATVAMTAGTFVTHFGQQVHFDGAKAEDAVLLIVGEGPATSTPAEVK